MREPFHRPRLPIIALSCLAVLAGACGGDSSDDDADADSGADSSEVEAPSATPDSESNGSVSADAGTADDAAASAETLTADELTAVAAGVSVPGLEAGEATPGGFGETASVMYSNDEVEAFVTLAACDPFVCWDLGGEVGAEQEANLRSNLAPIHLDNPDLVFDYGNVEPVPGYEAFYLYSLSFVQDGGTKAATNAYRLIFHDGVTSMTIVVNPVSGFLPDSAEAWEASMDRATAEAVANDVFAAFVDADTFAAGE